VRCYINDGKSKKQGNSYTVKKRDKPRETFMGGPDTMQERGSGGRRGTGKVRA